MGNNYTVVAGWVLAISLSMHLMMHVACANGKLDVSRLLINRGSDINSRDTDQFIPLHMASRFGHADIARLLLEQGSDVTM